ncbi:hypothetical protein U9M48_041391 [Paspalum notatum var. saurae]|uniref:Uncharacterized protein n=1 Tax=Paspalum notatum var. saurae TaxID=547442 RepID=A0AAQ3UT18_PASNO
MPPPPPSRKQRDGTPAPFVASPRQSRARLATAPAPRPTPPPRRRCVRQRPGLRTDRRPPLRIRRLLLRSPSPADRRIAASTSTTIALLSPSPRPPRIVPNGHPSPRPRCPTVVPPHTLPTPGFSCHRHTRVPAPAPVQHCWPWDDQTNLLIQIYIGCETQIFKLVCASHRSHGVVVDPEDESRQPPSNYKVPGLGCKASESRHVSPLYKMMLCCYETIYVRNHTCSSVTDVG